MAKKKKEKEELSERKLVKTIDGKLSIERFEIPEDGIEESKLPTTTKFFRSLGSALDKGLVEWR
jgi:hypothetical protein